MMFESDLTSTRMGIDSDLYATALRRRYSIRQPRLNPENADHRNWSG